MALSLVLEPPSASFSPSLAIPLHAPESELKTPLLRTRQAQLHDAGAIHHLIDSFTHDNTLLSRSYAEICENIHTFTIIETSSGQFIGCAALHVYGQHLAEIRSIVVDPKTQKTGAGSLLVRTLLDQAEVRGIRCVCLFTRIPAFFQHFYFRVVERETLPDKVNKDCIHCTRRNACDEIAMALGKLPDCLPASNFLHSRRHADLVQLQL
jgi:amino-acid N-acetyltransferase